MSDPHAPHWSVVVPVKGTADAKSRLAAGLRDLAGGAIGAGGAGDSSVQRWEARVARALALDTLAAVAAAPGVQIVVVSGDPSLRAATAYCPLGTADRIDYVPDPRAGLQAAIAAGVRAAQADTPVAVLLGDLPALRPGDLSAALAACREAFEEAAQAKAPPAAFVPDAQGTGTVLLAAAHAGLLHPAFGPGSAARHGALARRLDLDSPRLRRDVDTLADLRQAATLGLGRHTSAALAGALPLLAD